MTDRVVNVSDVLDRINQLRLAHADAIEYREALDDVADALTGFCGPDFRIPDASSNRVRPRPDCPHCEGTGVIYHMSEFPDRCPCRDAIPNSAAECEWCKTWTPTPDNPCARCGRATPNRVRTLPEPDPSAHENPDGPLLLAELRWRDRLRWMLTGRLP